MTKLLTIRALIIVLLFIASSSVLSLMSHSSTARIQWQNDCNFLQSTVSISFKQFEGITVDDCANFCLNNSSACSFFVHRQYDNNCFLLLGFTTAPSEGSYIPIDQLNNNRSDDSDQLSCGYVIPLRLWRQSTEDKRILLLSNCTYVPPLIHGRKWNKRLSSISSCQTACLDDYQCSAFSYNENDDDEKCIVPNVEDSWSHEKKNLNFQDDPDSSSECGVVTSRIWQEAITTRYKINYNNETYSFHENYFRQTDCSFNSTVVDIDWIFNIPIEQCVSICADDGSYCSHFNYIFHLESSGDTIGSTCHLMLAPVGVERVYYPEEFDGDGHLSNRFTCGFVPSKAHRWKQLGDDERVVVQYECNLFGSSDNGTDVIHTDSFRSCQIACLEDHRCNAFSYVEELCVLPFRDSTIGNDFSLYLNINSLLQVRMPFSSRLHRSVCGVVSTRNWNFGLLNDDHNKSYVSQINCAFNQHQIIQFPPEFNTTFMDCVSYCFNSIGCTHFNYYYKLNGTCYLMIMNASVSMDRVAVEGSSCGYIPNRLETSSSDGIQQTAKNGASSTVNIVAFIVPALVIFFCW